MTDLNTYAGTVLWSYAVSLALIALLIVFTVHRGRKARRALDTVEKRKGSGNG